MASVPTGNTLAIIAGISGWAGVWHASTLCLQGGPYRIEQILRMAALPVIWSAGGVGAHIVGYCLVQTCSFVFNSMFHPVPFVFNILALSGIAISLSVFASIRKAFRTTAETLAEELAADAAARAATTQEESDEEQEQSETEEGEESETEEQEQSETDEEEQSETEEEEESETEEQEQAVADIPVIPMLSSEQLDTELPPSPISEPPVSPTQATVEPTSSGQAETVEQAIPSEPEEAVSV